MIDNELQVRLLHAAKDRTGWKKANSRPKLGEVCLESSVDPNNSLGLVFKIKIGDNHRKFCRYIGNSTTTPPPLTPEEDWDFTSDEVLPYFGNVISASGDLQVAGYYTYPNDYETASLRNVTVIRFYQLSLTTTAGETTLSIDSNNYKEVRAGNKLNITHTSGDNYGKINHDGITTVISDNSSVVDEKDSDVITSLTTDGYGHITAYSKDKSSNMLAADLKGAVEQTDADKTWRYRVTGDTISIKEDTASLNKLDGKTLVWNQLVDTNTSSITLTSGNKYVTIIDGTKSLITGDSSSISVTGGTDCVFDLTKMFGSGNEPDLDTFEKLFPLPYYAYNEGQLLNVNVNALKTVGFNLYNNGTANVIKGETYYVDGTYTSLAYDNGTSITVSNKEFTASKTGIITVTGGGADTIINLSDTSHNGTYEPYWSDTTSVPITGITGISSATGLREVIFPDGLKSTGSVKDSIEGDVAYKRLTIRDYASGDESDSSVITDGTHTVVPLTTTVTYTNLQYPDGRPFTLPINYRVDDLGTEEWLPEQTSSIPINYPVSTITYKSNFKDAVLDTIDKVNNYKNPVQGKDDTVTINKDELAVYDSDYSTKSSGYKIIVDNTDIDPTDTAGTNDSTIPTIEAVVNYVEDNTVQEITTHDDDDGDDEDENPDNYGIRITHTTGSSSWDVSHASITQSTTDDGTGVDETTMDVVTSVDVDAFGHVTGKHTISSDKLIAADIKAPVTKTDNSTWNYRETGGDITIGEDTARIPSLKGNTIVWNQVLPVSDVQTQTVYGVTFTNNGDGSWIVNGTAESDLTFKILQPSGSPIRIVGHTYVMKGCPVGGSEDTYYLTMGNYGGRKDYGNGYIYQEQSSSGIIIMIVVRSGTVMNNKVFRPHYHDLTKMFGAGNEPTTVKEFEKLFPNSYYPYCEGRLVNLGGYGVKWNQLVPETSRNFTNTTTDSRNYFNLYINTGATFVYTRPTPVSVFSSKVTASENGYFSIKHNGATTDIWLLSNNNLIPCVDNHQYYVKFSVVSANPSTVGGLVVNNIQIIDLTEMFGSGSEPTLEEFEAMFPKDYYEYNAGTEMNIFDAIGDKKLGLESTGFNQWDEEWELGTYNTSTGEKRPNDSLIRCKNFIPCTPSTQYYFRRGADRPNNYRWLCYYDADKNFIGGYSNGSVNQIFETPANAFYMTFTVSATSYSNDICINLSDPNRNGTYEPYKKDTLDLDWIRNEGVENFNVWDEEWEVGAISTETGENSTSSTTIRCKNYIPVLGGKAYYFRNDTATFSIRYYDANKTYLGYADYTRNTEYTIPSNVAFIRFGFGTNYGVAYNNDVCINLSNAALNGEYHPHGEKAKYFPQGLLSAGSVHDEVTETKAIKRVGVVDLGSLSWTKGSKYFRAYITGCKPSGAFISATSNMIWKTESSVSGNQDTYEAYLTPVYSLDWYYPLSQYADGDAFKSAMSGVMLYYELETPVEVDFDEPVNLNYAVDDHGTEQQLPINVSSVINAPFVGTFQYLSNFKDTVLDIINKVNGYKNPVKSKDNVSQTVGKFATYDTSYTVHSSEYQVKNNPFEGAETAITLPTAEQIIEYVNTQIASSLTYKGVVSGLTGSTSGKIYFSGISNPSSGDLYFLGNLDSPATSMVVDSEASSTYHIAEGTYYPGTMFIWNADTVGSEHWDAIAGTTTISDGNPKLWVDEGTSVPNNRTQYTVGSIEGHDLHVTVPEIEEIAGKKAAGQVLVGNGTGESDDTATWRGLKLDETVDNSSTPAKISTLGTGVLERYDNGSGDNHDYQWRLTGFPDNFDANQKLGSSQEVITNDTTVTKVPHIYKSENVELKRVKNSDNDVIGFSTYVPLLSKSNNDAVIGTVLAGNYDINSETHDALPSWRNLKLDELSYDGTNLVPSLGTGFLKRDGDNSWSITNNLLTWKASPSPFNLTVTDLNTDNTGLLNKIYNYPGVTTIQQLSHTSGSGTVIDGFRVNVPLITDSLATPGKVLIGKYDSTNKYLPEWGNLKLDDTYEIVNLGNNDSKVGYLKRKVTSGTGVTPVTYGWELDPYGGGSLKPSYANNTAVTASEDRTPQPSAPNAGLREQTGANTYKHYKIPFSAIENDPSTGNDAVTIILNGNFN